MISEWISQAAMATGDTVQKLEPTEVDRILESIRRRFTAGDQDRRNLWEEFEDDLSRKCIDGWQRLCEFPEPHPLILFQDTSEFEGFSFPASESLHRVLAESPGFEFYLTNAEAAFVICFNHHDYLIGVGTAKDWLATIPEDHE